MAGWAGAVPRLARVASAAVGLAHSFAAPDPRAGDTRTCSPGPGPAPVQRGLRTHPALPRWVGFVAGRRFSGRCGFRGRRGLFQGSAGACSLRHPIAPRRNATATMQNRRPHAAATPGAPRVKFMPDPSLSVEPCSYCRENSAPNAAQQARRCACVWQHSWTSVASGRFIPVVAKLTLRLYPRLFETTTLTLFVFGSNTICASPRSSWRSTCPIFWSSEYSFSP